MRLAKATSQNGKKDLSDYQKRPIGLAIDIYENGTKDLSEYQKRHV